MRHRVPRERARWGTAHEGVRMLQSFGIWLVERGLERSPFGVSFLQVEVRLGKLTRQCLSNLPVRSNLWDRALLVLDLMSGSMNLSDLLEWFFIKTRTIFLSEAFLARDHLSLVSALFLFYSLRFCYVK